MADSAAYVCDQIDRLITLEFRVYGMHTDDSQPQTRGTIHTLYEAAREQQGESLTYAAAKGIIENVEENDVVIITTGWVVPFWIPHGETDGTPGALAIARALSVGLGARVIIAAEEPCHQVLRAGLLPIGLREYELDFLLETPATGSAGGVALIDFTTDADKAPAEAASVLDRTGAKAVIAIEKAGRNAKGVYHTGLANDFSETCAKTDHLIDEARRRGIFTNGIIDIGNEIGSGNIYETVREVIPWGAECKCPCGDGIASTVETDTLIVTSACNFGGYGLAAALGACLDNLDVLHDVETEKLVVMECCRAGAIDGATVTAGGFRILNGVNVSDYAPLIQLLRTIVQAKNIRFRINALRT